MLVTLVGLAFLFGLILKRVGLPPMVGFLLAGFVFKLSGFEPPEGLVACRLAHHYGDMCEF